MPPKPELKKGFLVDAGRVWPEIDGSICCNLPSVMMKLVKVAMFSHDNGVSKYCFFFSNLSLVEMFC